MNLVVSKKHRVLVMPDIPGASAFFPEAKRLDDKLIIPHDMRSMKLLQHLGFKNVPNPLALYYEWPYEPFNTQRATFNLLTENCRAYNLSGMGTGKTRTAYSAWDALYRTGMAGKLLVVAPLSTLEFVWGREALDAIPERRIEILHGSKSERLHGLARDADVYIINHDGVKVIAKELLDRKDIDALVLDELAVYRNNSDRSKQMRKFAERFSIVWGLTGAPMPNQPTDVWAQCKIITPNSVPKYWTAARDVLMVKSAYSQYLWLPRHDAVETAFKWMQPAVRYTLDDVVELPECVTRTVDVDLSQQQKKVYEAIRKELVAAVQDKTVTAVNAGVAMGKLLQVAGGWVYTRNPEFVRLEAFDRITALKDIINSTDRKVLVFVPYRHMLEGISAEFNHPKVKIDHAIVHGETRNRNELFVLFQQSDKYKVLMADPRTVHHGLTLTAADTIIWYLPITSLEVYDQANARIRRVGQTHKQQVIHMQSTPVERKIYKLLADKRRVEDQLLDMFEEASLLPQ